MVQCVLLQWGGKATDRDYCKLFVKQLPVTFFKHNLRTWPPLTITVCVALLEGCNHKTSLTEQNKIKCYQTLWVITLKGITFLCIYSQTLALLLGLAKTCFYLQNSFSFSQHRINKTLETFPDLRDEALPFHHISKELHWIEIWWLWRAFHVQETSLRWSGVCDMVQYLLESLWS